MTKLKRIISSRFSHLQNNFIPQAKTKLLHVHLQNGTFLRDPEGLILQQRFREVLSGIHPPRPTLQNSPDSMGGSWRMTKTTKSKLCNYPIQTPNLFYQRAAPPNLLIHVLKNLCTKSASFIQQRKKITHSKTKPEV